MSRRCVRLATPQVRTAVIDGENGSSAVNQRGQEGHKSSTPYLGAACQRSLDPGAAKIRTGVTGSIHRRWLRTTTRNSQANSGLSAGDGSEIEAFVLVGDGLVALDLAVTDVDHPVSVQSNVVFVGDENDRIAFVMQRWNNAMISFPVAVSRLPVGSSRRADRRTVDPALSQRRRAAADLLKAHWACASSDPPGQLAPVPLSPFRLRCAEGVPL